MAFSHPPVVILILMIIPPAVKSDFVAHSCDSNNNYTANSTYGVNLKNLTSTLLSSITPYSGFFNYTVGNDSDQVFGLALCRGDVGADSCRSCVKTSISEAFNRCPYGREEILWYEQCFLHYSPTNFFSKVGDVAVSYCSGIDATKPQEYNSQLTILMNNLTRQAVNSDLMFASGFTKLGFTQMNSNKLFGLVQCTRDLSKDDCYRCLQNFITATSVRCYSKYGAKLVGTSCMIRYEFFLFYNGTDGTESSSSTGKTNIGRIVILVVSLVLGSLIILLGVCACLRRTRKKRKPLPILGDNMEDENFGTSEGSHFFDSSTIRSATNHFSKENQIGEGGFGPVYKGKLINGQEIAVKMLSVKSHQGLEHLKNEVKLLANHQHKNLVKLFGCSVDGPEKLLIYEYLSNTSLDKFLFDPLKRCQLDWQLRLKIIEGIARGLVYLHEDSRLKIVHRDLKVSNILLEADMNPKISDFGLAKLFNIDAADAATNRIVGTYGYMSPEYAMHGLYSTKSDVFSYGIIVLEILTGRTVFYIPDKMDEDLLSYVWRNWSKDKPLKAIDKSVTGHCPSQELIRCMHIALLCVQEDPSERPNMTNVIIMLRSQSIALPGPTAPMVYIRSVNSTTCSQTPLTEGNYGTSVSEIWEGSAMLENVESGKRTVNNQ